MFYNFLHENNTQVFTTEDKFKAGKKDKILYLVKKKTKKKNGMFTSYINQIEDAGDCGIYHYVK